MQKRCLVFVHPLPNTRLDCAPVGVDPRTGALGHDPLFTKATEQAHKHRLAIDHFVEAVKAETWSRPTLHPSQRQIRNPQMAKRRDPYRGRA